MGVGSTEYLLPEDAESRLDSLVSRIEAAPGPLIDPRESRSNWEPIALGEVLATLPAGLVEDDFVGILHLALLTECATDSYAAAIVERARWFDAGWLHRFTENVWRPDELTHHAPYKWILMNLGFAEYELDRQIRQTQEREFIHYGGDTPVHVTTFGMVQEYLTDHWHGLISMLLRPAAPQAAFWAGQVKRRETLHTTWYRDMTALQLEAEPDYMRYLVEELSRFRMPGNSLVPELQSQAERWLPLMGADMRRVVKDLLRLLHSTLGNPDRLGRLLVELAAMKSINLGPLTAHSVEAALNRLGGKGYGLVGEAALEMSGLGYLFRDKSRSPETSAAAGARAAAGIRGLLRSWLAAEMAARMRHLTPTGAGSLAG